MATTLFSGKSWHWWPTMWLSCSYTATRRDERTASVHYKFDFTNEIRSGSHYGSSNALGIRITVDDDSTVGYLIGNNYDDRSGSI